MLNIIVQVHSLLVEVACLYYFPGEHWGNGIITMPCKLDDTAGAAPGPT